MRRFFSIASALSLLLLAGTLILWVRSSSINDSIAFQSTTNYWCLVSDHGRFIAAQIPGQFMPDGWSLTSGKALLTEVVTGVVFGRATLPQGWRSYDIPCLTVAAVTATLPVFWTLAFLFKRRRSRPGICTTCNYDLTGNSSGTCPECGMAISRS